MNETPGTAVAVKESSFSNVPAGSVQRAVFLPTTLKEAMDFANFMAGGIGVRQWMRGNPSACLMVIQQALRWGMDPYAVANKCYYQNDTLCFEAQLVNAVINTSGVLDGRLKIEFSGDARGNLQQETLVCRVSGRLKGSEQLFVLEQPLRDVKIRNSPIWKVNPQLQLAYHSTRSWARLYMPEVLLGVYTPDEVEQSLPSDTVAASPAPDRRDFAPSAEDASGAAEGVEDAEFEPVDAEPSSVEPEKEPERPEKAVGKAKSSEKVAQKGPDLPVNQSDIPNDPLGWAAWEAAVKKDLEAAGTMERVAEVRREAQPALDVSEDEVLDRVQEAFSDRIVALSGRKA